MTQSMIKGLMEYLSGDGCGEAFKEQWITKNPLMKDSFKPNEAMIAGKWFEYNAVGIVHKGEAPPQPLLLTRKSGDYVKGDPKPMFRHAIKQADKFKELCKQMKIKVLEANVLKSREGDEGTLDIICLWNNPTPYTLATGETVLKKGDKFIVDLKYSGNLDDRWSDFGWEDLHFKGKTLLQAKHYNYLTGLPFLFWVFDTKEDYNRMFYIHLDDNEKEKYKALIQQYKETIKAENLLGWTPRPGYKRCRSCPLFSECSYKTDIPIIEPIIPAV